VNPLLIVSICALAVALLGFVVLKLVNSRNAYGAQDGPTLLKLSSSTDGSVVVPVSIEASDPERPKRKLFSKAPPEVPEHEVQEMDRQVEKAIDRLILTD
jgi:hypothetical protein